MPEQLPHNAEAEAALVARLYADPSTIPVVSGMVRPEDIYDPEVRTVYSAMTFLSLAKRAIDMVTLSERGVDEVAINNILSAAGPLYRAPVDEYVSIVRRDAQRRRIIESLERVTRDAYEREDVESILSALADASSTIAQGAEAGRLLSPAQASDSYADTLTRRLSGEAAGLTWGLRDLDKLMQPAAGGEMVVIAARPGVGKTTLAETIAETWAEYGPVLFCSLEMSVPQLLDRSIARHARIPSPDIIRGRLSADQERLARDVAASRREVSIWYLDDPFAQTGTVRAAAARVRILSGGLVGIVIDYLQLLKDGTGIESEVQRVTRISRQVKALAREYDVPVLCLSQLSRAVESRDDKHPKLYDLRESGAIEQDADRVLGLYRVSGEQKMDVELLKNRQGPVGIRSVYLDTEYCRFIDDPVEQMQHYVQVGMEGLA